MGNFFESLSPNVQRMMLKYKELSARGKDFRERWMRGEIDLDGIPIPRDPQKVAGIKARIASTRKAALIGSPTEARTVSRLGGLPNLPESIPWPQYDESPMALVAQIDLAEMPKSEEFEWLPASGVLFYFAGRRWDEWVQEASTVLYLGHASDEQRAAPPDTIIGMPQYLRFEIRDTYKPLTDEEDAGQFEDNNDIASWHSALTTFNLPWQIGGWPTLLEPSKMYGAELLGQFDLERIFARTGGYIRGFFLVKPEKAKQGCFEQTLLLGYAD